ncbi:MAG: aminoacyl-tRNA hydrolase [Gammaproteobacteria bacterium]|nr:aminoacyl-tRNA hydrolase [Gammaproteobacteria bacterium]
MACAIKLVAGLGNPGNQYAETRHNAGFRFLDAVARRYDCSLAHENRFHGDVGKAMIAGSPVWLIKPQTFMNLSGDGVATLARFYKIEPAEVLVAHDELDIPPGEVRLKQGGGHGGHNGLRDIHNKLGSSDYMRLRIGIGHPGNARQVSNYVLTKAVADEQSLTDAAIQAALDELEDIINGNFQKVMNRLHAGNGNS